MATAAQLAAAKRLARRGALVRNAGSIEALGRVEVLCIDKTGTVTEGRIELSVVSDGTEDQDAADLGAAGRTVLQELLSPKNGSRDTASSSFFISCDTRIQPR